MRGVSPEPKARLGPYELLDKLGSGGMAEVFLARTGPHGFAKRVAIKRILAEYADDPAVVEMFCDEARLASRLSHPNIAQVFDFGEHGGELFIAMEYIDGVACSKMLRAVAQKGWTVPVGAALYITREVLSALAYAHEACDDAGRALGVVHRDVSPSNVLIGRTGEVKLIDFGITRSQLASRRTVPGELKGKFRYMSPEQVIGADVDARSDLFAVGVVLAEMLTAKELFGGANELEVLSRVYRGDVKTACEAPMPELVRDLLYVALAHRPDDRFATAKDFGNAVTEAAEAEGLVLDERTVLPWLSELDLLSSASGTRPATLPNPEGTRASEIPTLVSPEAPRAQKKRPPPLRRATRGSSARGAPAAVEGSTRRLAARRSLRPVRGEPSPSASSYRLRMRSGKLSAPISRSRMLECIATGLVGSRSAISPGGRAVVPLGKVHTFSFLAFRPAYAFGVSVDAHAEWVQSLSRATLPYLLFNLALHWRSGLLVARDDRRQKRIYFENGDPVFVASTHREELLGHRLVASGAVSRQSVERALAFDGPMRLGERLVAAGAISAPLLLRELVAQLEDRVLELGHWREGELLFVAGARHGELALTPREPTLRLISRLVRSCYDASEIATLLGSAAERRLSRTPRFETLAKQLGLSPTEAFAIEQCDGRATLRDLCQRAGKGGGASMADTLRAVFIGLGAGIFRLAGWPRIAMSASVHGS